MKELQKVPQLNNLQFFFSWFIIIISSSIVTGMYAFTFMHMYILYIKILSHIDSQKKFKLNICGKYFVSV